MGRMGILLISILLKAHFIIGAEIDDKSIWNPAELNTAATAHYLSPLEKEIIFEINKLRSNPAKYAKEYIEPLKTRFNKNYLFYPGDKPLLTKEGKSALVECVNELKKQPALPLVSPNESLYKAARDHVRDQSRSGRTGHLGQDRSLAKERIERYGRWKVRIGENIAYGPVTARQVVIYLLIDDGISDRGHRKNLLHPDFKLVGVASGNHPRYNNMHVMDFAGAFIGSYNF